MKNIKFSRLIVLAALVFAFTATMTGLSQPAYAAGEDTGPYTPQDIEHTQDPAIKGGNCSSLNNCTLIKRYINPAIALIATIAGVGITIGIIWGGIQYSSSGGDPQKAAAGKRHISQAVIALLAFIFLYALLRFLLPGGTVG